MPARLIVHLPEQPSRVVLVREDRELVLGRDPACDVPLDDDRVSRRHAVLRFVDGRFTLSDLGSKNGTFVDGSPALELALPERAWLSLGGLLVEFHRLSEERLQDERLREHRRWTTSLRAQRELAPSLGREELLRRLLRSALEVSAAERGFVLLRRADGELEIAASEGVERRELEEEGFRGSMGVIERVLERGAPIATADVRAWASLAERPSITSHRIRALVCLPLDVGDRRLGALYLDSRREGAAFDELDVEILGALSSHAALAVAVAALQAELATLVADVAGGSGAGASPAVAAGTAEAASPSRADRGATVSTPLRARGGGPETER